MKMKSLFRMKRSAKIGTYTFVMGVVVMAVLIIANLLIGALPAKVTEFDLSNRGLTEISDATAKFVGGIKEDVTIYWLCESSVVEDEQLRLFLTRYAEENDHITLEIVDPVSNPTFTSKYTSSTLSDYSLIIESDRRYQVIDYADITYYTSEFVNEYLYSGKEVKLTEDELKSYYTNFYSYYGIDITSYGIGYYDQREALVTGAIDYVTRETIPHAYILSDTLPDTLAELLDSMTEAPETVDLQNATAVPADAGCLILVAPTEDISTHAATLIKDYLRAGGTLMLATSPENVENCPNIMSLGEVFGLSAQSGVIAEGDTAGIVGTSVYNLKPTVSTEHYITYYASQIKSNYSLQMPHSHGIVAAETLPAGVTVTPLFTTSDKATRESLTDGSPIGTAGTQTIAVAATLSLTTKEGTTDTAEMVWFGSSAAFGDELAASTDKVNYNYFAAAIGYLTEVFSSPFEAISAVSLSGEYLTGVVNAEGTGYAWTVYLVGAVTTIVIPVGLLTTGIVIWVRRKRR